MSPSAFSPTTSISQFVLRNAPALATSRSLMLALPVFLLNAVNIGWAIFHPVSLSGLPDVRQNFFTSYLVSLAVVAVWLCLARHFSVTDRYGARNIRLEVLDLCLTSAAIGLVMLPPFLAGHLLSARISSMATVPQIIADINDVQRAIYYPFLQHRGLGDGSIISYWGEAAAQTESSRDGTRLTSILGIMSGIDATQRAVSNVRARNADAIAADLQRFFEVLHRYSPDACRIATSKTFTIPALTSDVLRFDQLSSDRPMRTVERAGSAVVQVSQMSEQDKLRQKYDCISVSAVVFATGQMLLSKGMAVVLPIYKESFLMQYSLAVAIYSTSFVFLMGTLTQRYLLWLAPRLAFMTFLLPGLLSRRELFYYYWEDLVLLGMIYLVIICACIIVYYRRYRHRVLTRNVRDYILATVAAFPAVLFVATNMYAAFETLYALVLPWLPMPGYVGDPRGDEMDQLSGAYFLSHLSQQKTVIQVLGYAAIPYALVLFWLRRWLITLRSRPGVL